MPQGRKTEIRTDLFTSQELRAQAKGDLPPLTVKRMLAIANALDGMSFTASARAVGLERQALGDAAQRYNAEGLDGLKDRPRSGRPCKLSDTQRQELAATIIAGPDPETDGISAYTLDDLCALSRTRFEASYCTDGMSRLIKRLGFSRQKARPHHPDKDEAAQAAFKGLRERLKAVGDTRPHKKIRLFFQDEARVGQKGRVCHRWFTRGQRPPGKCDQRYTFAYIFGAVEAGTDNAFALVLPEVSTHAMQVYLDKFAETIKADEHVVLVLDQAGWHGANDLEVPACMTLVPLPPRSPELNPVERLWLYLKERFLSHRLLDDYDAIEDAICKAWQRLIAEAGRLTSLTAYPWIMDCVRN